MKERFCSLLILGPGAPRVLKLHLSRRAIALLLIAFVLAFFTVILIGHTFPQAVNEFQREKLEAENRALKAEASNAALGIEKLNLQVTQLEEASKRIDDLIQPH